MWLPAYCAVCLLCSLRGRVYSPPHDTFLICKEEGILLSITHAACVISPFSPAQLLSTLWTVALQAPLSMGFSRQEHWSGLPCPPPGDLPDPGVKPTSLTSPALAGGFFTISATWEALLHSVCYTKQLNSSCCCLSKLWTKSVLSPLLLV